MKSAVIATVFTYLIGAIAAPVGNNVAPTDVDASALRAVLNGDVSISAKDAELVTGLLSALAKRDEAPSAAATPTSTTAASATPSLVPDENSLGATLADILEQANEASGGKVFNGVSPDEAKKILDELKSSHQEIAPFKYVLQDPAGTMKAIEDKLVTSLKDQGVSDADIKKMYDQNLISGLLGTLLFGKLLPLLSGGANLLPVLGSLLNGSKDNSGNPVDGLLGGATQALGNTVNGVTGTVKGATDGLTKTLGDATGVVKDPAGAVGNLLGDVTGTVKGATDGVTGTVKGATKGLPGGDLVGNLTSAVQGATGGLNKTASGVPGAAKGLTDTVASTVGSVVKRDEQGLTNTLAQLEEQVPGIGALLASLTQTVGGTVKGVAGNVPVVDGIVSGVAKREEEGLVDSTTQLEEAIPLLGSILSGLTKTVGDTTKGVVGSVPVVGGVANGILKRQQPSSNPHLDYGLNDLLNKLASIIDDAPIVGNVVHIGQNPAKGIASSIPNIDSMAAGFLKREVNNNVESFNKMLKDLGMDENEFFTVYADRVAELATKLNTQ